MSKLSKLILVLEIIFMIWLGLSWIEVCCKNLNDDPKYSNVNLFKVVGLMEESD